MCTSGISGSDPSLRSVGFFHWQAMLIAAWLAWAIEGRSNTGMRSIEKGVYWAVVSLTTVRTPPSPNPSGGVLAPLLRRRQVLHSSAHPREPMFLPPPPCRPPQQVTSQSLHLFVSLPRLATAT